jgi:hypothetical protein
MQVPQFLLEDGQARGERVKVMVTQPRRIAAITLARRVADQRGVELGTQVRACLRRVRCCVICWVGLRRLVSCLEMFGRMGVGGGDGALGCSKRSQSTA